MPMVRVSNGGTAPEVSAISSGTGSVSFTCDIGSFFLVIIRRTNISVTANGATLIETKIDPGQLGVWEYKATSTSVTIQESAGTNAIEIIVFS